MTTAVVDSPENEQGPAWWFRDTLVVEHRCAPEMDSVVLEMACQSARCPRCRERSLPNDGPGVSSPAGFRTRVVRRPSSASGCLRQGPLRWLRASIHDSGTGFY